jgi:hypothetical protein
MREERLLWDRADFSHLRNLCLMRKISERE